MRVIFSLVLGGYVNGYSIIKELREKGLENIVLFDYVTSLSSKSNKIKYYRYIDKSAESLRKAIFELKAQADYIVIFPTEDTQLENLYAIYDEIKDFCFIPINRNNIIQSLDKYIQYKYCEKYGIPYPKTLSIESSEDAMSIVSMEFPLLIKPKKRVDLKSDVFRSLLLNNLSEFNVHRQRILDFVKQGVAFLVSEYIPGNDDCIYAYVGYRSQKGEILNEWTGKKLTQYPDNFGVFSSASNEAPMIVRDQGRQLLEVMDLKGICEPEFKYDVRDGQYKLMEINLRSMMWHRIGNLSGVNIQYTQYLDAIGKIPCQQEQNKDEIIHLVYMKYEILNLLNKKGYFKKLKHNLLYTSKRHFAIYDSSDMKPFLFDCIGLLKCLIMFGLKALKVR